MGVQFDRVAIIAGTSEFIVLETQVMSPDAHGNGPRGGVLNLKEGWISVTGTGEARLWSGEQGSGGDFPPRLTLSDAKGKLNVEIAAHDNPTPNASHASVYLEGVSGMLSIKDEHGDEHTLLEGAKGNL